MFFFNLVYATTTITLYTTNNYTTSNYNTNKCTTNKCTLFLEVDSDLADNVKAVLKNDLEECDLRRVTDPLELNEVRAFLDTNYKSIFISSFDKNKYTRVEFSISSADKVISLILKDKLFKKNYKFSIKYLSVNAILDKIKKIKEECKRINNNNCNSHIDNCNSDKWEIKYVKVLQDKLSDIINDQFDNIKSLLNLINDTNSNYKFINDQFTIVCREFEDIQDRYKYILYYIKMYIENNIILEEEE